MKKILKPVLLGVAALATLAVVAVAVLLLQSDRKRNRVVGIDPAPVAYASGADAVQRGEYLYRSRACIDCHADNGAGRVFIDDANGLQVRGANLTRGAGSAVARYTERDWVRALRHGVKPDGRPLFVMPSEDYNRLTDSDLADVVAYVRALPPVGAPGAEFRLPLLVRLVHGAGVLKDAAEKIDHTLPPAQPVPVGKTVAHGRYVAQGCIGCHGAQLRGGAIAGAPPDWPPAANLKGDEGVLARYRDVAPFKTLLRHGVRPDGSKANKAMPTNAFINDTDIEALFLYLKSLGAPRVGG
jgi:mono/diheme cytochrome c family protein